MRPLFSLFLRSAFRAALRTGNRSFASRMADLTIKNDVRQGRSPSIHQG